MWSVVLSTRMGAGAELVVAYRRREGKASDHSKVSSAPLLCLNSSVDDVSWY